MTIIQQNKTKGETWVPVTSYSDFQALFTVSNRRMIVAHDIEVTFVVTDYQSSSNPSYTMRGVIQAGSYPMASTGTTNMNFVFGVSNTGLGAYVEISTSKAMTLHFMGYTIPTANIYSSVDSMPTPTADAYRYAVRYKQD